MKNTAFLLLLLLIFLQCTTPEEDNSYSAKTYTVYLRGNKAGKQTSHYTPESNTYTYTFTYNDRGRGPNLKQTMQLNAEGDIISIEVKGVNYLKDSVLENFTYQNGKATWKSNTEKGEAGIGQNALYSSYNSTIGDIEMNIRKMLVSPSKSTNLLPSGSTAISSIEPYTFSDSLELKLVTYTGMAFIPQYVWLDSDDRVFAIVEDWLTTIPETHAQLQKRLLEIQTEKQNLFFKTLAKELTEYRPDTLYIINTTVFDSNKAALLPKQTVTIVGNTITNIKKTEANYVLKAHDIDGSNKILLPGMFDNHCHVVREDGLLHLAAGVTSVRDMANSRTLIEIKKEFDTNENIGPRIVVMAGFIDQKGPFAGPGLTITSVEEGLKAIEDYHRDGYKQIKLYSSIAPEWVAPMAEKAHALGMRLSGHIPAFMLAEDAIHAGYDEIQHVNMLALNFLSDTIDSRTPLRFSAVASATHGLDLEGADFLNFIQLLKDKQIAVDPTVSIFEGMFTALPGMPDPQFAPILERLPIQIQRSYYSSGLPIPENKVEDYANSYQKLLDIILVLHQNNIPVLPGTDATPGFALHSELENYVKAGIPAPEVLQLATIVSARITGTESKLGSIEVGKLADVILVDGNPFEDISDIRKVVLTIKDGNVYLPKKLYPALGILAAH